MRSRFDRWFRSNEQARRDIDEEIHAHLDLRIEHLVSGGMTRTEARVEALRRFGDLEAGRAALLAQARAERRRRRVRDTIEQLLQDARYAARALVRTPAFSLGVVTTLALGLGINSATFRVADQVLFRPPAGVRAPSTVRRVEASITRGKGQPQRATSFSYNDVRAVAASNAFSAVATYSPQRSQREPDGAELAVLSVDAAYFPLLGVTPVQGRNFTVEEAEPLAARGVAIVSFNWWQSGMGGAPLSEHSTVTVRDRVYQVIGVAPRGFIGIDLDPIDIWVPHGDGNLGEGTINGVVIPWHRLDSALPLRLIGRVGVDQTDSLVNDRLAAAFLARDQETGRPLRTPVLRGIVPVGDSVRNQDANRLLGRLTGVAAIVLLLACANTINLLLARGLRRRQELGIRIAIGASRARIVRLLVVESLLLATAGGIAAGVSGFWIAGALRRLTFPDARWTSTALDERTLLFTAAMTVLAGMTAGLLPALQVTGSNLSGGLKDGVARGGVRSRTTRAALIVVQTAMSLALLVTSGLLVLSLVRLNAVHLGFDPDGLITISVNGALFGKAEPIAQEGARLSAMPGVREVALAAVPPFGTTAVMSVSVPGSTFVRESLDDQTQYSIVSDNYFAVLGTRITRGRSFLPSDVAGAEQVAVVNEAMLRNYWPRGDPFSSCILMSGRCPRVVGVVEDVRDGPGARAPMRFYLPLAQDARPAAVLLVRTSRADTAAVAAAARSLFPATRRAVIEIVAERVARALRPWRTATLLFVTLGIVALALAAVGIYSVMTYLVSERTYELGIRVALGATGGDVIRLIVASGGRVVALGGAIGLLTAAAISRVLKALLFGVSPFEPAVYALSFVAVTVLGILAMLPPARRAAGVNPVTALRSE